MKMTGRPCVETESVQSDATENSRQPRSVPSVRWVMIPPVGKCAPGVRRRLRGEKAGEEPTL